MINTIDTKDRLIHRLEHEQLFLRRQVEALVRSHAKILEENQSLRRENDALAKWNDEDRVRNRDTFERMMRLACHPSLASQWVR